MNAIDASQPVMISGATGYVAGWIVKRLLEEGCTVHAAVRDPSRKEKLKSLDDLAAASPGSIRYFRANLLESGSYAEAMEGCAVVLHTASPFTTRVADPQKDLVDPAVLGTRNVLEQAKRSASVRRIVVTSSCAAIYGDNADLEKVPGGTFTEKDWNSSSSLEHQPYSYSKTMAEREAWAIAESQGRWKLVCINPSLVMGPAIDPDMDGESIGLMIQFGDGTFKRGVPDMGMGIVDVRDVAEAHVAAAFRPEAHGRNLVSGHNASLPEIAAILREHFGDHYPVPKGTLPKWLVWLVGPLSNKALSRKVIARNVGYPWRGDNGKSRRELGLRYRELEGTVTEMFQQLIEAGRL